MKSQLPRGSNLPSMHRIFVPKRHRRGRATNKSPFRDSHSQHRQPPPKRSDINPGLEGSNTSKKSLPFVKSFVTEREDSSESSYFIGVHNPEGNLSNLENVFLRDIQMLDFSSKSFSELKDLFSEIVQGHVKFDEIYPNPTSLLGQKLISNGLFHEMWHKVIKKDEKPFEQWLYYQKYQNTIKNNYSNFQHAFNQEPEYSIQHKYEVNIDSNTNLRSQPRKRGDQYKKIPEPSKKKSSFRDRNEQIKVKDHQDTFNKGVELGDGGRVRLLGQIQSNERRLNAEIVCYFLGITKVYNLEDIQINKIVESAFSTKSEMALLEAHALDYSSRLDKNVINYRPTLMIIMYGTVNLKQLLRLSLTYGTISAFVAYDETFSIVPWLREKHFQITTLDLDKESSLDQ